MSEEANLSEAIKPLLGMVAGSVATNVAIISMMTKLGMVSGESMRKHIDRAASELELTDPQILSGLESYLIMMRNAIKENQGG